MNPIDFINSAVVNFQYNPEGRIQLLEPEIIKEKRWTKEYEGFFEEKEITWTNSTLSISITSGGSYYHPFKAYIFDTSSSNKNSFTIFLEDQVKGDSYEARNTIMINIDLKNFAKPGTTFKVMTRYYGEAGKLGESTFSG